MKKITLFLCIIFFHQINSFAGPKKEYFFEEQPSYNISFSKEEVLKKLNKIAVHLTEVRLSNNDYLIRIQLRTQLLMGMPSQPIFNAGFFNGNTTCTFYFNSIFNNDNKTIRLVSGEISAGGNTSTERNAIFSDDVFIRTFETNIINYINDKEIVYINTDNRYVNTLFGSNQVSKIVVGFNMVQHASWGSRRGDGLNKWNIRDRVIINRLYALDFLRNIVIIDEQYYWYRFPDIIIAIEYELTDDEKKSIVNRINDEMNNFTKEELELRLQTSSLELRSRTKKEIFEEQLTEETGPRNFMLHIWRNNKQYLCQISDSSIYCLIDVNKLNEILNNVVPATLLQ